MGKLFPPFKVDIAGALCVPFTLRDARNRYQHGQISLSALRAIENKEICKLMERLKLEGIKVVTDGGFRSYDFLEGWEGIRCRDNADSSLEKKLEVTGRIGLLHHPIFEDFVFLLKNTAENVLPKQHIPSPGKMLMRILRETEAGCLKSVYPDLNILLDDLAVAYKKLLEGLYEAGCRVLAQQELKQVKSEIRTDKLKSAATDAATAIASGVGSLFGSGKLKDLEQTNENLRHEIAKRDKGIDELKAKMQQMQEQHGKQIRNLQGIHNQELEIKDKEISRLNTILEKAFNWFPLLKEMLRMEKFCYAIGFTKDMVNNLLTKKEAIRCNGKIYSEEHRRKFDIKNDIFKIEKSSVDNNKLVLTINRQPIGEWFKEQWEKLRQGLRQSAEEPRKSRGFKL